MIFFETFPFRFVFCRDDELFDLASFDGEVESGFGNLDDFLAFARWTCCGLDPFWDEALEARGPTLTFAIGGSSSLLFSCAPSPVVSGVCVRAFAGLRTAWRFTRFAAFRGLRSIARTVGAFLFRVAG